MKTILCKIGHKLVEGKCLFLLVRFIGKVITKIVQLIFNVLSWIARKIDRLLLYPARFILSKTSKIENKILFITFQGDYTCNPKWIAEGLRKADTPYQIVWAVRGNNASVYPLGIKLVDVNSYDFYKELATAKIVIENTNSLERLVVFKKKGQTWIQTWHGSLGIKCLDGDIVMNASWKRLARKCRKDIDYLYSNSSFESEVFETAYWKGVPALLTGHARNDLLFLKDPDEIMKYRRKVCRILGMDPDKKFLIYAPTHRDDVGEGFYGLDYKVIKEALEERFGGEWQIVVRLHNRLKRAKISVGNATPDYVFNATSYDDMQELLLCADAGLTDYSSWIFDYVLTGKPGFIIELDAEDFKNARGFYYPIETTPFPIAKDSKHIAENIRKFDEKKYAAEVDSFLEARGCMEDGKATQRIVEHINNLMQK